MENIKRLFSNGNFLNDMSSSKKQKILDFIDGINTDIEGKIQICTIIDYYCENSKAGQKIYEKLVNVINSREVNSPPAKFNFEFIEKEHKARFTLFGDQDYIIKTLQLLQ